MKQFAATRTRGPASSPDCPSLGCRQCARGRKAMGERWGKREEDHGGGAGGRHGTYVVAWLGSLDARTVVCHIRHDLPQK